MQLQFVLTVAAALVATSSNALPYAGKGHPLTPAAYAKLHPSEDIASTSSLSTKRQSSTKSRRAPNAGLAAVINFVRRQSGQQQQPLMTFSSRKSLQNEKRDQKVVSVNSGVPGAAEAALKAYNATSVNATVSVTNTDGSTSSSNMTISTNGTITTANATDARQGKIAANRLVSTGGSKLSVGYWADWTADDLPPESIPWAKYDVMNYAFAVPNSDSSITLDSVSLLKRMVAAAHANGTKLVLSIGGAGQSSGFVKATATDSSRSTFVTNLQALITKYNVDGFDFDWEYPNDLISSRRRRSTSDSSGQDTKNFQTFLQAARAGLPSGTILSAAVPQSLWQDSNGNAVGSVARAASALDYIFIMSYDTWGSSSTPGPNSPLANLCGNSTQPIASAAGGVKAWTSAGMPRSKIVLGLPMYGYINTSSKTSLIQKRRAAAMKKRAASVTSSDGTTGSGQINFNSLVSQGALKLSSGIYVAGTGWTKYWDRCSDTPYLANGKYVLTYDDPVSLQDKAEFAYAAGLAGAGVWSIDGDTSKSVLINAIRSGLRKS